jgi:hypothetical protein
MFENSDKISDPQSFQESDIEELKENFKTRLDLILNTQINIDNISDFAEESLKALLDLNESILSEYRLNNNELDNLSTKEVEDLAYEYFGLQNVPVILDKVSEIKERIERIEIQLGQYKKDIDEEITPPDDNEINKGEGEFVESHDLYPRLLTFMYILETDFDLGLDN